MGFLNADNDTDHSPRSLDKLGEQEGEAGPVLSHERGNVKAGEGAPLISGKPDHFSNTTLQVGASTNSHA